MSYFTRFFTPPLFSGRLFLLLPLLFLSAMEGQAQCNCKFTIPAGTGMYTFDGAAQGAKPGDVICLATGLRGKIVFTNLVGSSTNYIKIMNCSGLAEVGSPTSTNAITFNKSRYFKLTGTGDANLKYGIKIVGSKGGTQGIACQDLSSDFELDHIEITKTGFAGIMTKSDPSKDCANYSYERPNFTLYNINIHDNYLHEIGGEGIYCGNSFYTGAATQYCGSRTQYPHEIRGVRIYNNIFESCGWESIQVGSAVADVEIHDNKIYDYGKAGVYAQNGGIQMGVGSTGKIFNNFIKKGTGIAIFVQGIGNNFVYNNVIINSGTGAILMSLRATPLATDIVPTGYLGPVYIVNNTIIQPTTATVVKESVVGPPGNVIYNNLVVEGPSNWLSLRKDTDWKTGNNLYIAKLADAKFVNPAADDYRLLTGSPAINTGRDVTALGFIKDFDNNNRPIGAAFDLGAFEFGGKQKPAVSVGANQDIKLPTSTAVINGSATDSDGIIVSYLWTKQSGPAATLANESTPELSVSNLAEGVYVFRLTATDNSGDTGYADVTVTVTSAAVNQPPVAYAGLDKIVVLPLATVTITGTATDKDGTVVNYSWTKLSGPTATITNPLLAALSVNALLEGVYVFQLLVTDDKGDTDTDEVTVTVQPAAVNQKPVAKAGADQNLILPTNSVNLVGSGSDLDGSIATYLWTKRSGPSATITNTTSATLQLSALVSGTYVFRLTVTDDKGADSYDEATVSVTTANQSPVAYAGADEVIKLPTNSLLINGSGSDPDGAITSYAWTKISGPAATLTNTASPKLSLSALVAGVYKFRLTVTDNNLSTGVDDVIVTVNSANTSPVANAGAPKNIILPVNGITLFGSGSDLDGSISTYLWEKVSGPSALFPVNNTAALSITNMVEGTYTFKLTVTDNEGANGTAQVKVVVFPASINQAPVAQAGMDILKTLPDNTATLTGSATDADGTVDSYLWEKINGPLVTITTVTPTEISLTNLVAGTYVFRFTATDNQLASSNDDVTVTVSSVNQKPIVSAGQDKILVLPTDGTTLSAVASDPDGSIASYAWTKVSGPSATITGSTTSASLTIGDLLGVYIFRVTVTDDKGDTNFDEVKVTVQSPANVNPIASAGNNVEVFLPATSTNLSGSGLDSDGTIAGYNWTKVSGDGGVTLTNTTTQTVTLSGLIAGVYTFRLTVTDNTGASGFDDVQVTVNAAAVNQLPVANAGQDQSIVLPLNSINLSGSGTDINGSIAGYLWTKVSGPAATLSNTTSAVLSLQNLTEGIYSFRLTVTDNDGAMGEDIVQLVVFPPTVNQSPTVSAGEDVLLTLPANAVELVATASDPDGVIVSYAWSKSQGPAAVLDDPATSTFSVTDMVEGTYIFRVTVTDNKGANSFDEVRVTVLATGTNQVPVVNAGENKSIFLPTNTTTLSGSAFDPDGSIASYQWNKLSGPFATLSNETNPVLSLADLIAGTYIFELMVTDDDDASASDFITLIVFPQDINQAPVVNAGVNQTILLPQNSTVISGSVFDLDGTIVSSTWTQLSGPASTLSEVSTLNLSVTDLTIGVYQYELTAEDDDGATGSGIVQITVVAEGANLVPVADAGADKIVFLSQTSSVVIVGSGIDTDGSVTDYLWVKKSGPSQGTISNQNTSSLTITNLVAGTYQFTLTIRDNSGASNSDDVKVTVLPGTINSNPIVNAGKDAFLRLPASTTTLEAVATDLDGVIVSYLWSKLSGPAVVLDVVNSSTLSLSGLTLGTYVFRVEVMDDKGAIGADEVTLSVIPDAPNQLPVVSAGSSKEISLPVNTVTLNGSATDKDGTVEDLLWTQQSGPSVAGLSAQKTSSLAVSSLQAGAYVFRLTATDNEGATAFGETTVTVGASNFPPLADAGRDTTVLYPMNSITIKVSGEDPDGVSVVYDFALAEGPADADIDIENFPFITINGLELGVYQFVFVVTDVNGATATDDIIITVREDAVNPIGASLFFSPNNDEVNQYWTVRNLSMIEGCPIQIFNRIGTVVYEASSYENQWTGVTTGGQQLKEGDYYYRINCTDQGNRNFSGALRLIR